VVFVLYLDFRNREKKMCATHGKEMITCMICFVKLDISNFTKSLQSSKSKSSSNSVIHAAFVT